MPSRNVVRHPVVRAALAVSCCGIAAAMWWSGRARPARGTTLDDVQRMAASLGILLRERESALQLRTSTIAELPRLAAAVVTNEATVRDLLDDELAFRTQPDETIVIAQRTDGVVTPLVRLPVDSPIAIPLDHANAAITVTPTGVVLTHTVSIIPTQDVDTITGALGVGWTIDRATLATALVGSKLSGATLFVDDHPLALAGAVTASPTRVAIDGVGTRVELGAQLGTPAVPAHLPLRGSALVVAALGIGAALLLGRKRAAMATVVVAPPSPRVVPARGTPTKDTDVPIGASSRVLPRAVSGLVTNASTPPAVLTALGHAPALQPVPLPSAQPRRRTFAAGSAHGVAPLLAAGSTRIGKYESTTVLGSGSTATVFLARSLGEAGFEKRVALKLLHPQVARDRSLVDSFLDEARTVSHLSHPNIVQILDLGRTDDGYFIAMEYIDGGDLETLLVKLRTEGRQVPINVALRILRGICSGLDAAHLAIDDHGQLLDIVHRDVKPANIMLSRNGEVKVTDFGIAKVARSLHQSDLTLTKGTPAFMAPEQRRGANVDARTDVYSVAAIAYELLSGTEIDLDIEQLLKLGRVGWPHLPDMLARRPELPPELAALVMTGLAFDAKDRPSTCDDLESALAAIQRAHSLHASEKEVARWLSAELSPAELRERDDPNFPAR